ncbi:hypothetical protein NLI96_g6267 [Meripilus lineatus]|uniref:Phosphatidate cytidylyltransferase n=1 Tax=Meripilus lineatus TaxID=2056292 RepID=A0AAD5V384_9APHY|nr:hypothetical protein NLI96_g6267 [Physisporinus lineatus]
MSGPTKQDPRTTWVSKTGFDALGVESGEDTDEEELVEESVPSQSPEIVSGPSKPSKNALKKARAAARQEKRQQERAARAAARLQAAGDSATNTADESPLSSSGAPPSGSSFNPVTVPEDSQSEDETQEAKPPIAPAVVKPTEQQPVTKPSNGSALAKSTISEKPAASPPPPPFKEPIPILASLQNYVEEQRPVSLKPEAKAVNGDIEASAAKEVTPQESESQKKRQNALTRTLWTFIMIGGFITLLLMGHAYMVLLVMLCQTLVYREVTSLFSLKMKGSSNQQSRGRDPWSKTLNWYFFAVANYFLYGESIIYYFKHVVFSDANLTLFATNHRILSFTLYTFGFVSFVMSLKRGYLKQQFGLFCWVHMTLLFIVVSSHFIVNNILEGMIWFWVPASLVICNDVFAYIWGITLGRTPLIKLSPKKTVEGFVGAFFSTVVFGVIWGSYFMRFDYMICPVRDLGVSAFDGGVHCTPNPIFVWREWTMPGALSIFLSTILGRSITTIPYVPYQFHLLFMSCFASLVAPFGGFFASGFKRAFNIKDFGHSIPGHGGMTDRMDCQFLMGVFTYVYYSSLIREHHVTVGSVLQTIVSGLTVQEQLELMADLKRYLEGHGVVVNL